MKRLHWLFFMMCLAVLPALQSCDDKVFTLTLDLNSDEGKKLKAGQKYFFRIGALPKDLGEGIQAKYNYSPVFEIQL